LVTAGSAMHTGSERSPSGYHDPCPSISPSTHEYVLNEGLQQKAIMMTTMFRRPRAPKKAGPKRPSEKGRHALAGSRAHDSVAAVFTSHERDGGHGPLVAKAEPGRSGTGQAAEARPAATRLPIPPAPGARSSRLKSAMRSKMPQRRPAGLSALRIDLLKASLSSPKVTSKRAP
jgi:hypothetical protein